MCAAFGANKLILSRYNYTTTLLLSSLIYHYDPIGYKYVNQYNNLKVMSSHVISPVGMQEKIWNSTFASLASSVQNLSMQSKAQELAALTESYQQMGKVPLPPKWSPPCSVWNFPFTKLESVLFWNNDKRSQQMKHGLCNNNVS